MQINQLALTNFRCFEQTSFRLAPHFNLIVGNNATGKTAILDALAIAAAVVIADRKDDYEKLRSIKPEEVRRASFFHNQNLTLEPQFPCLVECDGVFGGKSVSWKCRANSDGKSMWLEHALFDHIDKVHQEVRNGSHIALPIVAYYGTERLRTQTSGRKTSGSYSGSQSRFEGYRDCLNPASNVRSLLEWFRDQEFASLQREETLPTLEACRKAIATCIPDSKSVYFDATLKQLVVQIGDQILPMSYLSDGYRNMLAMVADIAIRCATLNPQFGIDSATKTEGIVLIDELDLHLHPRWQRQVIPDLMEAFPNIQFVATTHSPFAIQSLPASANVELINLDDPTKDDVTDQSIEDIAEWIQGVQLPQRSHRYLEMMDKAKKYFAMLKEDKATEKEKQSTRRELEDLVLSFSDSPAYHAFIKMQELAAQKENNQDDANAHGGAP